MINRLTLDRYRNNYRISPEFDLTPELVEAHWEFERRARSMLLEAAAEDRWETAETAYRELYTLLRWHDQACPPNNAVEDFSKWVLAVGTQPKSIYEIGSGRGGLLRELVRHGHTCRGTEITRERGQTYLADEPRISWGNTDGVHLDQFEPENTYDIVITNQVIEHLHPHDLDEHFRSARRLLRAEGKYIFSTPHRFSGPHDLCLVFGLQEAEGMHLKEYTWGELVRAAKRAGFVRIHAATTVSLAHKMHRLTGVDASRSIGTLYLCFMRLNEFLLGAIPWRNMQQSLARLLNRLRIFSENIFLICSR